VSAAGLLTVPGCLRLLLSCYMCHQPPAGCAVGQARLEQLAVLSSGTCVKV
jgi:hypothetical protein